MAWQRRARLPAGYNRGLPSMATGRPPVWPAAVRERRRLLTGELCLRRSEARVEHHGVAVDRHDLLRHEEGPGLVSLLCRILFPRWRQKLGGDGSAARVWRAPQELEGQVEHEAGWMIVTELPVEWPSDHALQAVEARFHARRLPAQVHDALAAHFATMLRRWHWGDVASRTRGTASKSA